MMNFIIGMITIYCIIGIGRLILNTLEVDDDIQDIIIGWWLIPLVIIVKKIHWKATEKKRREERVRRRENLLRQLEKNA